MSAGEYHSLALTADGAVWSWGWGWDAPLGHGDEKAQLAVKVDSCRALSVIESLLGHK